ncbi:MAG: hypothetical protein H6708_19825 [Kofleriaceae bacterium]|nr:hypothetical protein [Kofleriaceae bacterium]
MRLLLLTSLVLSLTGCRLAPFSELEDDATVVTLTPGNGYPQGGYGSVLTAYEGTLEDGTAIARVAISAGPGTPFGVHDAWHGGEIGNFGRRFEGCDEIGTDTPDCDAGASAALAHLPQWQGRQDCLMYSAVNVGLGATPGEGRLRIKCESTASGMTPLMQVEGVGYGTSLASMPAGSVHGPVLVGAPGAENVGQIHRLPPDGIATAAIPLPDVGLSAGARLGTALATAPHADAAGVGLDSDAVLIAAAAPGASRVVLYAMGLFTDPLIGGAPALTVRALACLDGVRVRSPFGPLDDGFGMTLGDTNADGSPSSSSAPPRVCACFA